MMQTYHVHATIASGNTLILKDLPFADGEMVEVIVSADRAKAVSRNRYPLRGTPVTLLEPTEPVAEADWETTQ